MPLVIQVRLVTMARLEMTVTLAQPELVVLLVMLAQRVMTALQETMALTVEAELVVLLALLTLVPLVQVVMLAKAAAEVAAEAVELLRTLKKPLL